MTDRQYYEGVGRRKTATARVRIYVAGNGNFIVNNRPAEEYLNRADDVLTALSPIRMLGIERLYDVSVHVNGGGVTGQAEAIRMGLARALMEADENVRPKMREAGFLTRDSREKERKKPGLKRARKAPTYTKR